MICLRIRFGFVTLPSSPVLVWCFIWSDEKNRIYEIGQATWFFFAHVIYEYQCRSLYWEEEKGRGKGREARRWIDSPCRVLTITCWPLFQEVDVGGGREDVSVRQRQAARLFRENFRFGSMPVQPLGSSTVFHAGVIGRLSRMRSYCVFQQLRTFILARLISRRSTCAVIDFFMCMRSNWFSSCACAVIDFLHAHA